MSVVPECGVTVWVIPIELAELFGNTAAVGREAFIDAKKPFYTACDHMLGVTYQLRGSIGQRGITIQPRWKAWTTRSAVAAVWAQDRRRRSRGEMFIVYELLFTLRRTQGAIGRYEGTTGAAVAAAGRLRRLGRCRRRIPGARRGLTARPLGAHNAKRNVSVYTVTARI